MCELFGVNASSEIELNDLLETFYAHSDDHPDGWGLATFRGENVSIEKQPKRGNKSDYLKSRLQTKIASKCMMAHIRKATRGELIYDNCHPFMGEDVTERTWTLQHNGTMFDCPVLQHYRQEQEGTTDSERILLHLLHSINLKKESNPLMAMTAKERFDAVEEVVTEITANNNKVNLIIYDGETMYVHTNFKGSLYYMRKMDGYVFSTTPLGFGDWNPVQMNTLLGFQNGELVFTGQTHENEFFDTEENQALLYLEFAGL